MVKQGYKQTEIGVIPDDWDIDILDNLTNRIGDGIHTTPKYSKNGEYYFINGNNLANGKILVDLETKKVSKEEFEIHRRDLNESTILLSINGTIGNISFFNNEAVLLGKSACYINLKERISKKFIFFIIQSNLIQKYFFENLTGSTIKNLGLGTIKDTKIPLPPLPEQQAIAAALSDVDAWITNLEQLIHKKRLINQGAMQQLLTPKEGWEVKKLGELGSFFSTNSLSRDDLNYTDGSVYNIHYGDIHTKFKSHFNLEREIVPFINQESFLNKNFTYCEVGDLIIADASENESDIGKAIEICNLNGRQVVSGLHTIHFKPHNYIFSSGYLGYAWQSSFVKPQILKQAQGTKVLGISVNRLLDLIFPIPSLTEQTRIATILSDLDSEMETLEQQLGKAQQIKQGMMQELLTGRVRLA